jgi:hypothetical protein
MRTTKKAVTVSSATAFVSYFRFLGFCNGDGFLVTDLDTALTTQAFLCVYGYGLSIFHLIHVHGANLHTFLTTFTLFGIYGYIIRHAIYPPII